MTKKGLFYFSVKDIVEIGIMVGLSIVLDTWLKIPITATGGSINFSMVPMFVVALRHGPFKCFIATAIVYGLITCLIDGYGFQTYPLEYFVAFGVVSVYGFFTPYILKNFNKNTKTKVFSIMFTVLSVILWAAIRFFCGSIDSVLFWHADWIGAFLYNWPYVNFTALIVLTLMALLLFPFSSINKVYTTTFIEEVMKKDTETVD